MAAVWESTAEALPSVGLAMFMAERAEAGDLDGTGARRRDPLYWYDLAMRRGSAGAAGKAIARLVATGRIDEAVAMAERLGPAGSDAFVRLAKAFARGDGIHRDRDRAAALLARVPDREANRIAAMLMREASAEGDADSALFWMARAGSGAEGVVAALSRLHGKATDPAVRETLLSALQARAAAGDAEASTTVARILSGRGEPPTPELVRLTLSIAEGGPAATADRIARMIARMPADEPATRAIVAELETAGAAGDVAALTVLSRLYATGGPVPVDSAKSRAFAEKASEGGSPEAQYRLGLTLAMRGGPDADRARALLASAADAGYVPARAALAALDIETGSAP
jgi:TPR repeat protein